MDYEKLGLFYIGKTYDIRQNRLTDEYTLYESEDLVTHAVCIGMTGSGKTGLSISIIEEAAIDHIPAIIIDPKGDLGNLLLTFPEFKASDFLPWINADDARKKGVSPEEYAREQANLWKKGLADWDQDGQRIAKFKSAAEFAIYTPGSRAGLPVSILNSLAAPDQKALQDLDLVREQIQTTTSGLLQLLNVKAEPLTSREHILLSSIIEHEWLAGRDLQISDLISMIQTPPFQKIGVFDMDSFFPAADRFKLAMTFNNLLAAPGFKSWMEGDTLDIDHMLYTQSGKPRISIFSIAHLSDSERMFFVTLLLNQMISWMRRQSGTTSLRALLYMDEVFGFFPPVGEPPSKKPLLTLLKQARAFGVGVMLSTQNPVDLDYKGLSNAGTWLIGRLQTERDKERLIDGLMGIDSSGSLDKKMLLKLISTLKKRVFLLHNVHNQQLTFFHTRWVLSYLRGPLTRTQIKELMKSKFQTASGSREEQVGSARTPAAETNTPFADKPNVPPAIKQYFARIPASFNSRDQIIYHPYLMAGGEVVIFQSRYNVSFKQEIGYAIDLAQDSASFSWQQALHFKPDTRLFSGNREAGAKYLALDAMALNLGRLNSLDKQFETYVYRNFQLSLWKSNTFKQLSKPLESERDFRIRLSVAAGEKRNLERDRIKRKYAVRLASLERQLLTARQRIERETDQYNQKKMDSTISAGVSLLGALFGGRRSASGFARTARSVTRLSKEKADIQRAKEKYEQLNTRLQELQDQLENEVNLLTEKYDPEAEELQTVLLRPRKADVLQRWFGIWWIPFTYNDGNGLRNLYPDLFGHAG